MKIDNQGRLSIISEFNPQEEIFLRKYLSWGNLDYNLPLDIREIGNIPVTEYKEDNKNYVKLMLAKLNDGKIYTIRYALDFVLEKFGNEIGFDYSKYIDKNIENKNLGKVDKNILDGITLRDYQIITINKALLIGSGIVKSAVGSGKTEMQIAITKYFIENKISDRVLIVCPNLALVDNCISRFHEYNIQNVQKFVSGMKLNKDIPIIVANIDMIRNQINRNGRYSSLIKSIKTVIFDEAHHLRADTFYQVVVSINPDYLYEFSGTPFQRNDFYSNYDDFLVYALCGRLISSISSAYLISRGLLAKPYIYMISLKRSMLFYKSWQRVYDNFIVKNNIRNSYISQWTRIFIKYDMQVLILVQRIEHMEILLKLLSDISSTVIGVAGSKQGKVYNSELDMIEDFPISYTDIFNRYTNREYSVIIATQVMDEGVNLPSTNAIILAGGSKSYIKSNQRVGRGLRKKTGRDNEVFIVDFYDNGHPYISNHSRLRAKYYEEMGGTIVDQQQFIDKVYDNYISSKENNKESQEN